MTVQSVKCVACGAPLQGPAHNNQIKCSYCGTLLTVNGEALQKEVSTTRRITSEASELSSPGKIIIEAKGVNGKVQLLEDRVRVKHDAILAHLTGETGAYDIPLVEIASVQLKNAGFVTNGFIHFLLKGDLEEDVKLVDVGRHENAIVFNLWQDKKFKSLCEQIRERLTATES
jgi:uncharacterized Zn finger protein (UPF0148 family)